MRNLCSAWFGDTLSLYDSLANLVAKINESFYLGELDSNDYVVT